MPIILQDVHIRQVEGGFIVRKNTVALDEQSAQTVGQRTDEQVCASPHDAIEAAATFLQVTVAVYRGEPLDPALTVEEVEAPL